MAKKRSAAQLVATSSRRQAKTWLDKLPQRDREYILEVVEELKRHPEASCQQVASCLREELQLAVSLETIHKTLLRMVKQHG